MMSSFLT